MVTDAGTASGAGALRPLNQPRPARVEAEGGWPAAVWERGVRLPVDSVEDVWRIDDEWWREVSVARTYFEVLLEGGRRLTLFFDRATGDRAAGDRATGRWYRQRDG